MRRALALFTLHPLVACGPTLGGGAPGDTSGAAETSTNEAGGEAEAGNDSGNTSENTTTAGDDSGPATATATDSGGTDGNPGLEKCIEACQSRDAKLETQGFCEIEWMTGVPCEEVCELVTGDPDDGARVDAVIFCIEEDPLCFQSLDQCVCMQLAPPDQCAP